MNICLYIDYRENLKFQKILIDEQYQIVKHLEIGDYMFTDLTKNMDLFIIERKKIQDWISSIKDGRYHEQKIRLLSKYPKERIMYILEGDFDNYDSKKILYSSVLNTMYRDNIRIFKTKNESETIDLLRYLYTKFLNGHVEEWLMEKQYNGQDYTNALLSQIVTKKSGNQTKDKIFLAMLCCIPGISKNIAFQIVNLYSDMGIFIKKIQSFDNDLDKLTEWITNIEIKTATDKTKKLGKIGLKILDALN